MVLRYAICMVIGSRRKCVCTVALGMTDQYLFSIFLIL